MKNKLKKILCFTCLLLFFLSSIKIIIKAEDEYQETKINNAVPKIKIANLSNVTLVAGEKKTITLKVVNTGGTSAYNILIQAIPDSSAPISTEILDNKSEIAVISAVGKRDIKLNLIADDDAKAGNYNINLKYFFTNDLETNFESSDSFSVTVKNKTSGPAINLTEIKNNKTNIMPGTQFSLSMDIENNSSQNAKDVKISLDGLKNDEINLANSTAETYFSEVRAGSTKKLSFDFIASSKIKAGSYPINFKVSYKDNKDGEEKTYEKSFIYHVKVGGNEKQKALLELTDIISPVKNINVGEQANISLKLKNIGGTDIKNIKVTAVTDTEGAVVPKSSSVIMTPILKVSESKDLLFSFAPTSKSKTQNYAIKFQVEYENGNFNEDKAEIETFEQYASLNINNPEEETSDKPQSKPKMIVSNYSTNPLIVTAGSEFDLDLVFKNTHKTKRAENTKVSLTIDEAATSTNEQKGNVFTPVNGSTTFFIGDIAPGASVSKRLRLYTVPTALPKNYSVTVDFEYEDQKHNEIKSSEKIGINVKQMANLSTSEINIPQEVYVNQPTSITFDFYNTGKVNLNNLLIKIEGDGFDAKQSSTYYGKVNTSTSDTYEGNFTPLETGEKTGKIIISYEDDAGEVKTQEKDFVIIVKEPEPEPENNDMQNNFQEEKKGVNWIKISIWSAVIIILILIAVIVIKKIYKKKKEKDLDE